MAGTYVQLTRQEFENWLDDIGFRNKWQLKPGRGGVYWLYLSDVVAIEMNSTTGSGSAVMQRGQASMKCRLISRVSGKTINRKAIRQSHFKRTVNWRDTWNKKGVQPLKAVYFKTKDWYDTIAAIKDREAYKAEMLALIEAKPNWQNDRFLSDLHNKVENGGILTENQKRAIHRTTAPGTQPGNTDTQILARIEAIPGWDRQNFLKSIHSWVGRGRKLTPKQLAALERIESSQAQRPSVENLLADLRKLYQVSAGADRAWIGEFGKRIKRERGWSREDGQHVDRLLQKYAPRLASASALAERFLVG